MLGDAARMPAAALPRRRRVRLFQQCDATVMPPSLPMGQRWGCWPTAHVVPPGWPDVHSWWCAAAALGREQGASAARYGHADPSAPKMTMMTVAADVIECVAGRFDQPNEWDLKDSR